MKTKIFTFLAGSLFAFSGIAQQEVPCGTDEALENLHNQFPQMKAEYKNNELLRNSQVVTVSENGAKKATTYIIPVVFHIMHEYGTENIPDSDVYALMEDLNADGFDDAVVSNYGDGTVSILLADGATNFLPQVALPVGASPSSLAVVDFDNDGDQDIALVASNENGDRVVQVLRNDLNLTDFEDLIFASATELGDGENPAMVDHGDMDGDGLIDLVTVSEASTFRGETNSVVATRENTQENINTCHGDLNTDGEVKVQDLLIMIAAWGDCPGCAADLNDDNMVNVHDLLILIGNWGPCA